MSDTAISPNFLRRGSFTVLAGQLAKVLVQLISAMVLGRILSPSDFGLVAMLTPLVVFFSMFRDLGLSNVTIQKETISGQDLSNMLWFNVGVACLIFLSVNATSHWVSVFYGEPRLIGIAALLSTTFLFNGVTAQFMAVLQRHLKIRRLVLADVLATFVGLVAAIFAALGGLGYWALAIQPVVSQAISLVVVVMVSSWRPGLPRWSKGFRGLVGAGTGYAGFNLLNFISRNLDDVLIGKLLGPAILGYYNRAYNLMLLPLSQITGPLAQIMVPLLSRQMGSPDLYRTTFLGALEKLLFLLSPFIMTNVVGADWLVKILLGDKWGPAAAIYSALGVAALTQPLGNSTGWLFISQGRSGDMFWWGVFSSSITTASFLVGIHWGVLGLAWSYAVVCIVFSPALWFWVGRRGPVTSWDLARVSLPPLAISGLNGALFALARHYWSPHPLVGLLCAIIWSYAAQALLFWVHPRTRRIVQDMTGILVAWREYLPVARFPMKSIPFKGKN